MRKSRGCCDGTSARILLCVTQYVHVVCTPSPYIFIEKHTISDRNSLSKNNSPRGTTLLHPSVSPTCQRSLTCLLPQMSISHLNLVKCRIRMMCLMCPKTLQPPSTGRKRATPSQIAGVYTARASKHWSHLVPSGSGHQ